MAIWNRPVRFDLKARTGILVVESMISIMAPSRALPSLVIL